MGLEESYQVPPPCTTPACVPPQGPNVVYERAYDQYGRPIIVVHQQPPPRTQMSYHNPPMQPMYPAHMQTYQPPPPYPVHTTNPYATVSTAQYPGQYVAQPSPSTLLTSPGYYYMPASTAHTAPASTVVASTAPLCTVQHSNGASLLHSALSHVAPTSSPLLAPLVSNIDAQHVSDTSSHESRVITVPNAAERVTLESTDASNVTLPGLTPLVSNTDSQQVSNSIPEARVDEQEKANDTLTPVAALDPEPLVSFSNVTVTTSSPLPGIETIFGNEADAKNSSAGTVQSEVKSAESPTRVKKSFNPLPRRQPTVKAYLAHEEL
jgi:hypothetical protein